MAGRNILGVSIWIYLWVFYKLTNKKMEKLKQILAKQISWYKEYTEKEKTGEVDSSYVYDMACGQFTDLSRSDYAEILAILSK